MSAQLAINSPIFLRYLLIVGGLLAFAGIVLASLQLAGRNVESPLHTYRGWLIMIPIVLGTLLLGREATIIGITLLAAVISALTPVPDEHAPLDSPRVEVVDQTTSGVRR